MSIASHTKGLQHLGLPTNDMEATLTFYQSLGFTLAHSTVNNGEKVCFLTLGSLCVETYENGQAVEKPGAIDHLCLDVDDVDAAFEAVKTAGYVPLEDEIKFLPFWEKGVRFFNILGPNREKIEFGQIL
ncbi:conserved hypothetical protein [uncultured Eubacteriales bacterium]|uniref:VOC domain-containing protein n=1 Tax=uncultured Eubacteriales bacterium TaxID=172733 RepID=A0A212KEB0_9FIRM|nr:conserved hypothetical protein [uncultured Eubacteriales bacterium]